MLLAFFHLGVDIDLIDCLGKTNVDSSNPRSHIFTVRVRPRHYSHTCREFVTVIEKRNI